MQHTQKVNDRDPYFEIDAVTRKIVNKSSSKVSVIQYDHNSERFTFSLPRFIEDHDMMESTKAEVHYISGKTKTVGVYEMTDLAIDPEDEDKVICTWLLSQNVTMEIGAISFLLRFSCISKDGSLDYAWNTAIFTGISVAEGIYNAEAIVEQYADVLEQWKEKLQVGIYYTKEETKEMIDSLNLEMYRFICANDLPKKVDVTTFNETVGNIEAEFDKVESIAKGRATGYVFDTVSDLDLWLKDENNVSQLVLGDNFYIRGLDVPDYWWDGKEKQQLETQKVDLSEYCTKKEAEEKVDITVFNEMMSAKADKERNYELIEKIIVGYSITTSEPEDWETNYTSYFKNTGTLREPVYTELTEPETWEEGTYFSYSSEDVVISVLDTEPDGTLFSFKGIILDITFSAATSNRNFVFSLRSNSETATSGKLLEVNESNAIKTTKQWYQACFEGFNGGAWKGFHNINYTIKPVISRQIPRGGIMRAIRLSNSLIPAGSTIIIYGVRA